MKTIEIFNTKVIKTPQEIINEYIKEGIKEFPNGDENISNSIPRRLKFDEQTGIYCFRKAYELLIFTDGNVRIYTADKQIVQRIDPQTFAGYIFKPGEYHEIKSRDSFTRFIRILNLKNQKEYFKKSNDRKANFHF